MTNQLNFTVSGMTCGHCESSVRTEVSQLPGVDAVQVSAATGALRIETSTAVPQDAVVAAVAEAGYQASPA